MHSRPSFVVVVQPLLAHYRFGTLSRLGASSGLEYVIAAGQSGTDGHLATFSGDLLPRFEALKNRRIGPAVWQSGVLRLVLRRGCVAVVFPGAAHDLSTWVAALVARLTGRRVLFWTTGWTRVDRGLKGLTRRVFYSLADRLLLYGPRGRELGLNTGYPARKMTVIFNSQESPDDTSSVEGQQTDPRLARSSRTILFVGRLNEDKRVELLFESLTYVRRPVRVVVIGDGPEREALERRAVDLKIDVEFRGAVYGRRALASAYAEAALTVAPGRVGLTAVQSIEFGVPVICNDDPDGQPAEWEAIIEGITGGHFRAGNATDLGRVIDTWFELVDNNAERYRHRCVAEFAAKWSAESHARRIEEAVMRELQVGATIG